VEQQTTQELKGLGNEAELAATFKGVFIETAFTAEQIERSKAAEKRMGPRYTAVCFFNQP
jgi:hypothetical protein